MYVSACKCFATPIERVWGQSAVHSDKASRRRNAPTSHNDFSRFCDQNLFCLIIAAKDALLILFWSYEYPCTCCTQRMFLLPSIFTCFLSSQMHSYSWVLSDRTYTQQGGNEGWRYVKRLAATVLLLKDMWSASLQTEIVSTDIYSSARPTWFSQVTRCTCMTMLFNSLP